MGLTPARIALSQISARLAQAIVALSGLVQAGLVQVGLRRMLLADGWGGALAFRCSARRIVRKWRG